MQKTSKTYVAKKENQVKKWYLVDASDKVLGRLATKVATVLRGKHKPTYTPHVDTGDYVVVVNAEKIRVTGKKTQQKMYFRHSGYPGGMRLESYEKVMAKHPDRIITQAVAGMLPKGRLGRKIIKKLKVMAGDQHRFAAQKLEKLEV